MSREAIKVGDITLPAFKDFDPVIDPMIGLYHK